MTPLIPQAAVIPVRDGRVCLVTSRSGARWVFPKGRIEARQTAAQAGLVEAWEEAGLRGDIDGEAVGTYRYEKRGRPHHVTVFVMRVDAETDDFPELLSPIKTTCPGSVNFPSEIPRKFLIESCAMRTG